MFLSGTSLPLDRAILRQACTASLQPTGDRFRRLLHFQPKPHHANHRNESNLPLRLPRRAILIRVRGLREHFNLTHTPVWRESGGLFFMQCFDCYLENVIAEVGSPTCRHHENSGLKWWPENWDKMDEGERIAWLEKKQLAISK